MMCRNVKQFESMMNYLSMAETKDSLMGSFLTSENKTVPEEDSLPPEVPEEDEEEEVDEEKQKKIFGNKLISGLWGLHRFEKNPWSAKVRPFRRLKHFESLQLGDLEKKGKLTKRMIACCLSYLERSPYDLKYALCKCQLSEKAIIDISVLRTYHYIQYLDLSHNKITTLVALSEMPYLQYLNASHNYIENPFDFKAPLYLTTVNYSNNKIIKIPNLSAFWSVTNLDMSFNCIREIKGLESLRYLMNLNLAHNRIKMLENLSKLRIHHLNLSYNHISLFENEGVGIGFRTLDQLTSVDFSYNGIKSLKFLENNEHLEEISITNNDINDLLEIYYLKQVTGLKRLNIANNLLCENPHFKALCTRTLPKLRELNGQVVSPEDRLAAATLEDISKLIPAHASRMRLLLLEHLNRPKIGAHVCPYDEPIPSLIVIVGPPASRKKLFASKFVEHSDFLKLGISHTTRPKKKYEIDGKDFYYTKYDNFVRMVRNADFLTVTEFNGHLYGIAFSELEKAIDCILVFYSDLETGLILKMAGFNPTLVLAMPQDKKTHIKWLKESYFFDETNTTTQQEITIKPCPTVLKEVDKAQQQLEKENAAGVFIIDDADDTHSYEMEDLSSNVLDSQLFKEDGHSDKPKQVYKNRRSFMSEKINFDDNDSRLKIAEMEDSSYKCDQARISDSGYIKVLNWRNYDETIEEFTENKDPPTLVIQDKVPNLAQLDAVLKDPITGLPCVGKAPDCKLAKEAPDAIDTVEESTPDENRDSAQSGILKKDAQDAGCGEAGDEKKKAGSWPSNDSSISLGLGSFSISTEKSRGSNQEDSLTRDRSSSNKRVSFTYGQVHEDEMSYDPNFFDEAQREHIKSVSNTHILRSMQNRFYDHPLLSVMSASDLVEETDVAGGKKEFGIQAKTAYMTLSERFDALKADKLAPYLARVMLLRKELLELHYSNPGLFHTIIFTDGDPNKCITILKQITKHLVETRSLTRRSDTEDDSQEYKDYVNKKFQELQIFDNRYCRLYEDVFLV